MTETSQYPRGYLPYYAVKWTERSGRVAEWHYGNREQAHEVAAQLRSGWRKDARVEAVGT